MRLSRQSALVLGSAFLVACGGGYGTGPGSNPYNNPGGNPSGSTPNVTVDNNFFKPAVDTVSVTTTVTWTWAAGAVPHTVTFQDGPTSDLKSSGTYNRTFTATGTYPYRCTQHSINFSSDMVGTIVVR